LQIFYTQKKRMDNYLVGDNYATYQRRDNGCNSGDAIGDGHHGPGKVWTEINMINLKAA